MFSLLVDECQRKIRLGGDIVIWSSIAIFPYYDSLDMIDSVWEEKET